MKGAREPFRSWPATRTFPRRSATCLSPAATEDAIRLLDGRQSGVELAETFGDILDTREAADGGLCEGRA